MMKLATYLYVPFIHDTGAYKSSTRNNSDLNCFIKKNDNN